MELVNIGADHWINPKQIAGVQVVNKTTGATNVYLVNGVALQTNIVEMQHIVGSLVCVTQYMWVNPEHVVQVVRESGTLLIRTTVPGHTLYLEEISDTDVVEIIEELEDNK